MKITFITLFPQMFEGPLRESILKNAQDKGLISFQFVNLRDFGLGNHKTVDDTDYGGGVGMVLKVDVVKMAIDHARDKKIDRKMEAVILTTADGQPYTQRMAENLCSFEHLIIICGHYEGIDERIRKYVDYEISIGDYVLTGGEIAAMIIADSVGRLIKGVLKDGVTNSESFSHETEDGSRLLEYPHYTKPQIFEEEKVPEVLLSGDHKAIEKWRKEMSLEKTKRLRPDLLKGQ